jgi:hypothetical protein
LYPFAAAVIKSKNQKIMLMDPDFYAEALLWEKLAAEEPDLPESMDENLEQETAAKKKPKKPLSWYDHLNIQTWSLIGILMGIALSRAWSNEYAKLTQNK